MSKTSKARKGFSKETISRNALFVSEAVAETDGISTRHPGMCKSEILWASNKSVFDSASEGSSSLKRKSMSVNAGSYKPTYLGVSSSIVHSVDRSTMSKQERKEFRKNLKLELDQILSFASRIEERVLQLKGSSGSGGDHACNSAHLSRIDGGGSTEKEVNSVPASKVEKSRSFTREIQVAGPLSMILSDGNLSTPGSAGKEKRMPKANQLYLNSEFLSGNEKMPQPEKFKSKVGAKRPLQEKVSSDFKHQKLEHIHIRGVGDIMKQCGTLLKKLMSHKHAWVFNEPVDAVKLGLPDYHKVIQSPMDLGTVKKKLASGQYSYPEEFAADARLTFANAMKYNPKGHDVHFMAESLRKIFEEKWKGIEEKLRERITEAVDIQGDTRLLDIKQQLQRLKGQVVSLSDSKPSVSKLRFDELPNRVMSFNEKRMLSEKVKDVTGDVMEQVIFIFKKSNPNLVPNGADIEVDLETIDCATLWELDRFLTECAKSKGKTRRAALKDQHIQNEDKAVANGLRPGSKELKGDPMDKDVDIGDHISAPAPVVEKAVGRDASKLNSASSSSGDSASSSSDSDSASSSASDSEAEDAQTANDCAVRASPQETEPSGMPHCESKLSPCSPGVAEDNLGVQSCDAEERTSTEDVHAESKEAPPARQLSPDKLLRAALLKGRFADTILKAKEKTLPLSKNHKVDPEKLKKEREELERRQREERARLHAEAKAAELARKKAEADAAFEIRRKREEEREAARLALQQMERTVEFNQEIELSKDLDILGSAPEQHSSSGGEVSPASSPDGLPAFGFRSGNPLEQLGLFMKDDYEDDYEKQGDGEVADGEIAYESGDVEEGEIDQ